MTTTYLIVHEHRHGSSCYVFDANPADVPEGAFSFESYCDPAPGEDDDGDPDTRRQLRALVQFLGVDFSQAGECVHIEPLPRSSGCFAGAAP